MIIELSYQKNCRDLGGLKTLEGKKIKNKRLRHLYRQDKIVIGTIHFLFFTPI